VRRAAREGLLGKDGGLGELVLGERDLGGDQLRGGGPFPLGVLREAREGVVERLLRLGDVARAEVGERADGLGVAGGDRRVGADGEIGRLLAERAGLGGVVQRAEDLGGQRERDGGLAPLPLLEQVDGEPFRGGDGLFVLAFGDQVVDVVEQVSPRMQGTRNDNKAPEAIPRSRNGRY
jgi:hypothetical protein